MEVYVSRLASFQSSSRKKPKWPHSYPTPRDLADAGFYYDPHPSSNDNVSCFLCKKALDGWDVDDNPVKEHFQHSRQCGWAILKYTKFLGEDAISFTDKELQDAREATFGSWWPHEQKRGWFSKIKKMSRAGFYYNPTPDSNDMVSCIYCGLGLDGWEPKDDPMEEHKKRAPSCLFFQQLTITKIPVSELKVFSNKLGNDAGIQNNDVLNPYGLETCLKSKVKLPLTRSKIRSIKKPVKKSKDNDLQSRSKESSLTFYEEKHKNALCNSSSDLIVDNALFSDNQTLAEQDKNDNDNKFIDVNSFSPFNGMRMTRSRINSFSNKSDILYIEKEITKASKLKSRKRRSQQIKKENNLNKMPEGNNYMNNININSTAIKKYRDESIIENDRQNDTFIKLDEHLVGPALEVTESDIFEDIHTQELQNNFIATKTILSKNHRKASFVKSSKSVRKLSLKRNIESNYNGDIEKKNILNFEDLEVEKRSCLRYKKSSRINTQISELAKDRIASIENSSTKKKPKQVLKINNIVNLQKGLENVSQISDLSEVTSFRFIDKENISEGFSDPFKEEKVSDFVMKNSFQGLLQQNFEGIFGFDKSENQKENAKNVLVSEIINNSDNSKITDWVPINSQALVFNSSSNMLVNSHELTASELDMTIEEWIKFITRKQVEKLEIECQRMISVLKKEGERAKQAILGIRES
ncbi:uncharacterized protein T551_01013 [Pneumocystis jirovecii RU7]|uniref:Inhibitor of apoptosis repeat-containing protein n=1 Tax=Pneumocystis jirovecii (strain RU7) TaxID=1408657 RepID=A0A0W4ZTR1_PNEJ7|nr:uncharacterized protein T551_01013 [Pneumocystis jirovecii RU7]KTW31752.1 hypothetical protein T551_01013 [Pneumocystis jirovecii RU7]